MNVDFWVDFWQAASNVAQIANTLMIIVLLFRVRRLQDRAERLEGK